MQSGKRLLSWFESVMLGRPGQSLENRRGGQRLQLRVPVSCLVDSRETHAEMVDVSAGGMRLVVSTPLRRGQVVRVSSLPGSSLVGRQRLTCETAWVKFRRPDYEVGLRYLESPPRLADSWVQMALRHLDKGQVRRRHRRIECCLHVQLEATHGSELISGICLNLSLGGCLMELRQHVSPGTTVRLGIGPSRSESSITMSAVVLNRVPGRDSHQLLYHLKFQPVADRHQSRLRSLVASLLDEQTHGSDEPQLDIDVQKEICRPRSPVVVAARARETVPKVTDTAKLPDPNNGSQLRLQIGATGPWRHRTLVVRSPSLWAARNLPVYAVSAWGGSSVTGWPRCG